MRTGENLLRLAILRERTGEELRRIASARRAAGGRGELHEPIDAAGALEGWLPTTSGMRRVSSPGHSGVADPKTPWSTQPSVYAPG